MGNVKTEEKQTFWMEKYGLCNVKQKMTYFFHKFTTFCGFPAKKPRIFSATQSSSR